jgi:hypothetical protein
MFSANTDARTSFPCAQFTPWNTGVKGPRGGCASDPCFPTYGGRGGFAGGRGGAGGWGGGGGGWGGPVGGWGGGMQGGTGGRGGVARPPPRPVRVPPPPPPIPPSAPPLPPSPPPAAHFVESIRVGYDAIDHCDDATYSRENAEYHCQQDPACQWILDYGCDGSEWRVCDWVKNMEPNPNSVACTRVLESELGAVPESWQAG